MHSRLTLSAGISLAFPISLQWASITVPTGNSNGDVSVNLASPFIVWITVRGCVALEIGGRLQALEMIIELQ